MDDLSIFLSENLKLNVRTTGVFLKGEKVLVLHCSDRDGLVLPGGRVKSNEDSLEAIKREVFEELQVKTKNEKIVGVIENFYNMRGINYHEYMWMYKLDFDDLNYYKNDIVIGHEGEKELKFEWMDIDELEKYNFKPEKAIDILKNMNDGVKHIIYHQE